VDTHTKSTSVHNDLVECIYKITAEDIERKFKRFKDGAAIVSTKIKAVVFYFIKPKDVRQVRVHTRTGTEMVRMLTSNTKFSFKFTVG
jgi:hypothetical protein